MNTNTGNVIDAKLAAIEAEVTAAHAVFTAAFIGSAALCLRSAKTRKVMSHGIMAATLVGAVGIVGYAATKGAIKLVRWWRKKATDAADDVAVGMGKAAGKAVIEGLVDTITEDAAPRAQELTNEQLAAMEAYAKLIDIAAAGTTKSLDFDTQPHSGTGYWHPAHDITEYGLRAGVDKHERLVFEVTIRTARENEVSTTRVCLFQRYSTRMDLWVFGSYAGVHSPDGALDVQDVLTLLQGGSVTRTVADADETLTVEM